MKQVTKEDLENKKQILKDATEQSIESSKDMLSKRKISDQDVLKLIDGIDRLTWALRSSDFDRMVYNEQVERRLMMIEKSIEIILSRTESLLSV